MKPQTLELSNAEVAALLKFLGKQPYEEVVDLIGKIQSQCESSEESQTEKVNYDS